MRLAILGESPADEEACRVLTEAILRTQVEWIDRPFRTRGWPSVLNVLPVLLKHLHYHTLVDGLVVVADSNHSPVHIVAHEARLLQDCRGCELRRVAASVLQYVRQIPNRQQVRVAVALPVPAIEAWYLAGQHPVSESAWSEGQARGQYPYTKRQLKALVYGTEIPTIDLETRHALAAINRVTGNLDGLANAFPGGFGLFRDALGAW